MDAVEALEYTQHITFEVDHSVGHTMYQEDKLHTQDIDFRYRVKCKVLHDSVMVFE